MTEWVPHQDLILDAIDQLRRRKARPDAERIYNCLFRRKGLGSNESRAALDRCVESGIVLRVSYKGNISYRNAAKKYSRQKRRAALAERGGGGGAATGGTTHRSDHKPRRKFTNLLTNTFAELVLQEPDYLELGIPPSHLINTILDTDSVRYKKSYLTILLQKEVESGGLVRLDNGNFLVGKPPTNGVSKHHQQEREKDSKEQQLTRIKREMRNQHVIHRKPLEAAKSAYSALQDEVKMDEDDEEEMEASEAEEQRRGRRTRTPVVDSEESQESRTTAQTEESERGDGGDDAAVVATRQTTQQPPATTTAAAAATTAVRRGRGRPPLKRGVLVARSRVVSKRERLAMEGTNNLRVGGRRKKAKKVFDPSESNMPKKRGRPLGSTKSNGYKKLVPSQEETRSESRTSQSRLEGGVCSVCHVQNKRGPAEKMISCRECSNKAHASCLNGDDMMLKMYPDNTWQCPHCKTCVVCFETSDAGNLVVCSICADAYHNACHTPKVNEKVKSTTKWLCTNCKIADQIAVDQIQIGYSIESATANDAINDETPENTMQSPDLSRNSSPHSSLLVSAPSSPTLPTLSPQLNHNGNGHANSVDWDSKSDVHTIKHEVEDDEDDEVMPIDENIDPSIPDASNWSADEVSQYFAKYFPQEARVFKEQEIDGHSLLLMRRMDVLKGLHLKLGPALKIYRHVLRLQYRRDDRKLYWV